jgi:hypothetical protein
LLIDQLSTLYCKPPYYIYWSIPHKHPPDHRISIRFTDLEARDFR